MERSKTSLNFLGRKEIKEDLILHIEKIPCNQGEMT